MNDEPFKIRTERRGADIDIQHKQLFSDRLRECAGEITTARTGRQIRETLSEAFILLSDAIREDEIPVQKLMMRCYLKGFFVGAVIIQAIIILFSQILGC